MGPKKTPNFVFKKQTGTIDQPINRIEFQADLLIDLTWQNFDLRNFNFFYSDLPYLGTGSREAGQDRTEKMYGGAGENPEAQKNILKKSFKKIWHADKFTNSTLYKDGGWVNKIRRP